MSEHPRHLTLNQSMRLWEKKVNWNEKNQARRGLPYGHPNQVAAQMAYIRAINANTALKNNLAEKHGILPFEASVNMWRTGNVHRLRMPLMKEVKNAHWKRQLLRELAQKAWNPVARMNRRLRRPYAKSASPPRRRTPAASPRRVKSASPPRRRTPVAPHKRKMNTKNTSWLATSNVPARPSNFKKSKSTI